MIMKHRIIMLLVAMTAIIGTQARDHVSRDVNTLPAAARTYVDKNFKADVSLIKTERKLGRVTEYEVILTDGSEVTFDRAGNWKEIEAPRGTGLPKSVVPEQIRNYVKDNHKGSKIVSIERKNHGYDIELTDGTDLEFDINARFIRYD